MTSNSAGTKEIDYNAKRHTILPLHVALCTLCFSLWLWSVFRNQLRSATRLIRKQSAFRGIAKVAKIFSELIQELNDLLIHLRK